jgi:parallel beta-helix repeat protein
VGGAISTDTTWTLSESPYIVTSSITVQGADGDDEITTLTIEPGVEVRFDPGVQLAVGYSSGDPGALVAVGTAESPILFTSNNATPAPGDWYNIKFNSTADSDTSIMDHCVVEYAGWGGGALNIYQSSPTIQNSTIRNCQYYGIYMSSSSATLSANTISDCTTSIGYGIYLFNGSPTISDTVFSGNSNYDINFKGTVGGTITGCTIENGIRIETNEIDAITGNTINYNSTYPLRVSAQNAGQLVTANTINNLDSQSYVEVNADTITSDATWTASLKYHVLGSVMVQGTDGDDEITTLTIEPGVEVRFDAGVQLAVGYSSGDPGALVAVGTAENLILFTSNNATPAPGDWYNIIFNDTADDDTSILDNCVIEYAGSSLAGIQLYQASPTIQNSIVRYCSNAGIYASGSDCGNATIDCNTFYGNDKGIYLGVNPPPELHNNNFNGNTGYGLEYTLSTVLDAENNWWNTDQGPNAGGDTMSEDIDADPWSTSENVCIEQVTNQPPNTPSTPTPADSAVRVSADDGVDLVWTGGDPNVADIVTYDVYWGTSAGALSLEASDLIRNTYTNDSVDSGITYYWQIIAKDDKGAETSGPVWAFTTDGDSPDLIISSLSTDPAGNITSGQSVTFTATVENIGSGPAVDAFDVDFLIDGTSIGTGSIDSVILAGGSTTVSQSWTYNGGDPTVELNADSAATVTETDEQNNTFSALLSEVADMTPPALVNSTPGDNAHLQQVEQITVTLADTQGVVDDTVTINSLSVVDGSSNTIAGTASESNDTFTFVPASLPLADSLYTVSLTAADTYGNTQNMQFAFTIDTIAPGEPVITGGTVESGTIQAQPVLNSAKQFIVELTGTRDSGTSVWINGVERVASGDADWSVQIKLQPGDNTIEVWLVDLAGNIGSSVWVDIAVNTGSSVFFNYDASGRVQRIEN